MPMSAALSGCAPISATRATIDQANKCITAMKRTSTTATTRSRPRLPAVIIDSQSRQARRNS